MDSKSCGNFIYELRKEKKLTQKELAEKLNVSDKAISRWETGKGFPDVNSLMGLSELFSVTVNELLAGKRIETENLNEIVEENVIRVIESKEKAVKKKKAQMIICSVLFLVLLLPPAVPTFVYIYDIILSNISFENITEFIGFLTVSAIIFAAGFAVKEGHISILHSYHYKNVVDREGYCKAIGKWSMFLSIPFFICSFITLFPSLPFVEVAGSAILFVGCVICIGFIFKYQYKYNGGLF